MEDIYSPRRAFAVTPDDNVDLPEISRMLYIGTGGDVTVLLADDVAPVLLKAVPTGSMLHIRAKRVLAAGTGALFIVALW